jgi:uncharacterized protein
MKQRIRALFVSSVLALSLFGAAVAGEDGVAAYQRGDYATAMRLFRPLADSGNARAQYNVGLMYAKGQGVPQDHAQAAAWFHKSADQGYADAQSNLGFMYEYGHGVPQDYAQCQGIA